MCCSGQDIEYKELKMTIVSIKYVSTRTLQQTQQPGRARRMWNAVCEKSLFVVCIRSFVCMMELQVLQVTGLWHT